MTVKKVYDIIDSLYPFELSHRYISDLGGFDNSKIILDTGKRVENIIWALDLNGKVLNFAKKNNAQLIITHHPVIFNPVNTFSHSDISVKYFLEAVQNGISIISMHINADAAHYGNDELLAEVLSPLETEIIKPISSGGLGRLINFNAKTLDEIFRLYSQKCNSQKIRVYGDKDKIITTAAVYAGAGLSDLNFEKFPQLFIASEIKHRFLVQILDSQSCAIDIPHYSAENYTFKKIYQKLKGSFIAKSVYFEDKQLL